MRARASRKDKKVILREGRFIRFVRKGEWEYFERNNCSSIVIVLAMTRKNEILFVEQYRPPIGRKAIEFPAGLVNDISYRKKESILKAAKRELLEETGYMARKIIKVLDGPVSSGVSADIVTVVRALGLKKVSDGGGDDFESIVVHKVPFRRAERWLRSMRRKGYSIEPKIYTGLYFLSKYNKLN